MLICCLCQEPASRAGSVKCPSHLLYMLTNYVASFCSVFSQLFTNNINSVHVWVYSRVEAVHFTWNISIKATWSQYLTYSKIIVEFWCLIECYFLELDEIWLFCSLVWNLLYMDLIIFQFSFLCLDRRNPGPGL